MKKTIFFIDKLEKIYANLFFLLFTAQILSPSIYGKTIYLEVFVAIINPFFLLWLKKQNIKRSYFYSFMSIMFIIIIGNWVSAVKISTILLEVSFLFYAYERNVFYLKRYLFLSIIVAMFQFYFTLTNPLMASLIGPENIAKTVWGKYATATNTNFYSIFLFPRVSGLSREAGFFASLIVAYIFFIYLENKKKHTSLPWPQKFILTVGYILSFSKMSLTLFFAYIIEKLKNILNKIPRIIVVIFFLVSMIVLWSTNENYLLKPSNITFTHRFGGYVALTDINLKQLIFGVTHTGEIDNPVSKFLENNGYLHFAGFAGFILNYGILTTISLLLFLFFMGVNTTGIILLILFTINVQFDTNQNFVVLTYFLILKFFSTKKIKFGKSNVYN